jgi:small subunit ribosomal protein S6
MRLYEEVFIVKPDAAEEEAESVVELLSKTVTDQGGAIENLDRWGRRKLAYRVAKFDEGIYFILKFSAKAETVKEVERRLRVNDFVIKFLTVRLDEKLKWVEKRKKKREERAKRKPPMMAAPAIPALPAAAASGGPAMPAAPAPAMPAAPAAPMPAAPTAEEKA